MESSDAVLHSWREWRRLRAVQLKLEGWYQRSIAQALGVAEATVSRWLARADRSGIESLMAHPGPGHPSELSPAHGP